MKKSKGLKRMKVVVLSGMLGLLAAGWCGAEVPLQGETGVKPALGSEPFPSRLHAFVWRNWTVVPQARLAEVLETSPENVARVAASMGLPPQGAIQPEWKDKGYITVLRRNWHLLPYGQLMKLLGMSREQLRYSLAEDEHNYTFKSSSIFNLAWAFILAILIRLSISDPLLLCMGVPGCLVFVWQYPGRSVGSGNGQVSGS